MDTPAIVLAFENSALGEWMRSNLKAMPLVEATHVLAVAIVFGTILIVDLRLLGYPHTRRSFHGLHEDLVRWTWGAFGIAVITGIMMVAPNASTYWRNVPFILKLLALFGAGVNMAVFERVISRTAASWDTGPPPRAARAAAVLSILIWTTVIFLGRWIGFTKGYDYTVPDDMELDFDFGSDFDSGL